MKLSREEALRGMTIDGESVDTPEWQIVDDKRHMLGIPIQLDRLRLANDSTQSSGTMTS